MSFVLFACALFAFVGNAKAVKADETRLLKIAAALDEERAKESHGQKTCEDPDAVFLTRFYKNKIKTTCFKSVSEVSASYPDSVSRDLKHFYASLALMNRQMVDACLTTSTRKRVAYSAESSFVCKRFKGIPVSTFGTPFRYILSKGKKGLRIYQRVRFNLFPTERVSKGEMIPALRKCKARFKEFWEKYGIQYDFDYDTDVEPKRQPPYFSFELHGDNGRSNADVLHFLRYHYEHASEDQTKIFCNTLLHEMGHRLGLEDTYEDRACPERDYIYEGLGWDQLMSSDLTQYTNLLPYELYRIIRPICND